MKRFYGAGSDKPNKIEKARGVKRIRFADRNIDIDTQNANPVSNAGSPLLEIISSLGKKEKVTIEDNEIIFNDDVTLESVRSLIIKINEANREFERSRATDNTGYVFAKPIYLHITSEGGDLLAGFMAYDAIKNSKIPIYTVVDAYAVSSGSIMFMAGKKRFMRNNSYVLIHQINQTIQGRMTYFELMDGMANNIEMMRRLYAIYLTEYRHAYSPVDASNILTKEILETHMSHDIFWNVETCFKYGLIDGLYTNYNDRDVRDRLDFTQKLSDAKIKLPTYDDVMRGFGNRSDIDLASDKFEPSQTILNKLSVVIKKNADVRKKLEKNMTNPQHILNAITELGGLGGLGGFSGLDKIVTNEDDDAEDDNSADSNVSEVPESRTSTNYAFDIMGISSQVGQLNAKLEELQKLYKTQVKKETDDELQREIDANDAFVNRKNQDGIAWDPKTSKRLNEDGLYAAPYAVPYAVPDEYKVIRTRSRARDPVIKSGTSNVSIEFDDSSSASDDSDSDSDYVD